MTRVYQTLILLVLFSSLRAGALDELPFPEVRCRDQLLQVLQKWQAEGPWIAQPTVNKNQPIFVAPTEKIGTWIQIQLLAEGTVMAMKVEAHHQEGVTWSIKNPPSRQRTMTSISAEPETVKDCEPHFQKASKDIFLKDKNNEFNDADLSAVLKKNKSGLILLWSPGMDYSLKAVQNATAAAKQLKMPLQILLDSEANLSFAKTVCEQAGLKPSAIKVNHSLELFMRGLQNHFPSLQVYEHGKFSRPLLPGLMTVEGYVSFVKGEIL